MDVPLDEDIFPLSKTTPSTLMVFAADDKNPAPVIVTEVPFAPDEGDIEEMTGAPEVELETETLALACTVPLPLLTDTV